MTLPVLTNGRISFICALFFFFLSLGYASATQIHNTRVYVYLPNTCTQNATDNWIQCRFEDGSLAAQFNFLVGSRNQNNRDAAYTQSNLKKISQSQQLSEKTLAEFKKITMGWIKGSLSAGGRLDGRVDVSFITNPNGVVAMSAVYEWENANGVSLMSNAYSIWDDDKVVDIFASFENRVG